MPLAPLIVTSLVVAPMVFGAVLLALTPAPFSTDAALLLAAGNTILGTIVAVGFLLARARWARDLGLALALLWVGLGVVGESPWHSASVVLGAGLLAAMAGPWPQRWLRRLPATEAPPRAAAALLFALVSVPTLLAIASPTGVTWASWAFAAWCLVLAWAVARAVPGASTAARFAHPVLAIAIAYAAGRYGGAVVVVSGAVVAVLAWQPEVRVAVAPLVPPMAGEAVRFPPELAPAAVLEAAGLDRSGRPEKP